MATRKTSEPFWWLLFSAGGMVAALLVPVHLFVHALAVPLGWTSISQARLLGLAGQPLVKLYLFVLIALPLYHWAHRFRFVLEDVGLHGLRRPIATLCYGAAVLGTAATVWVLWQI
jgi:fumarate reductase subunit D